jgi:hypothetical protein
MPTNDDTLDPIPSSATGTESGLAPTSAPSPGDPRSRIEDEKATSPPAAAGLGDMPPILPPTPVPAADPFDIAQARIGHNFGDRAAVKKLVADVAVDKPDKEHFIRVHPGGDFRLNCHLLRIKQGDKAKGYYWLAGGIANQLAALTSVAKLIAAYTLFTGITRTGGLFLWPIVLPDENGEINSWHQAAHEAATIGQDRWIRVEANMSRGNYDVWEAEGQIPDPQWPDKSLQELVRLAFKQKLIDRLDHPILLQLRGLE